MASQKNLSMASITDRQLTAQLSWANSGHTNASGIHLASTRISSFTSPEIFARTKMMRSGTAAPKLPMVVRTESSRARAGIFAAKWRAVSIPGCLALAKVLNMRSTLFLSLVRATQEIMRANAQAASLASRLDELPNMKASKNAARVRRELIPTLSAHASFVAIDCNASLMRSAANAPCARTTSHEGIAP